MSINNIVNGSITIGDRPLGTAGFGTAIAFLALTAGQETAWDTYAGANVKVIETTPDDYLDVLAAVGITSSDAAYALIVDAYSQGLTENGRTPDKVLLARKATWVAQVSAITVDAAANGDYTVAVTTAYQSDSDTFSASSNTITEIRDGLLALLGASSLPITYASVSTDGISATADNDGVPFIVTVSGPGSSDISVATSTPSTGIAEDIVAADGEDSTWYHVIKDDRTDIVSLAMAEAVEGYTRDITASYQTSNAVAQTSATTDVGALLQAAEVSRTWSWWHNVDAQGVEYGIAGKQLPKAPGSTNWAGQGLASMIGIDPQNGLTSESQLIAKNYNYLERFAAKGTQMTRRGIAPSGLWIDNIRGRDWLLDLIKTRFLEFKLNQDVIRYTAKGRAQILSVMRGALDDAGSPDISLIEVDYTITAPTVAEQGANKALRDFPGIRWHCVLQGAVNTFGFTGFLNLTDEAA